MPEQDTYRRRQAERDANRKKHIWQKLKNLNPDRIVQGLLVVFTFGIVVVGALQWNTLNKSDDTTRSFNRAFLYFLDPTFFEWPPTPKTPNVLATVLHIVNTGNMPARQVVIQFSCPTPLKKDEKADPFNSASWITSESPNVIGAKQGLARPACNIPLSAFSEAQTGVSEVFVMFKVTYLDGLSSTPRVTQMSRSFRYDFDGGKSWGFVAPHNCTDNDCPK